MSRGSSVRPERGRGATLRVPRPSTSLGSSGFLFLFLAGCIGPALRPVAPPGPGEVALSVSVLEPDLLPSTAPLEIGATAAVGLTARWSLQAEAGWDTNLDYQIGGGVRYTHPIDASHSYDVSVGYDQISVKPARPCEFLGFAGEGGSPSPSSTPHNSSGLETLEMGLIVHKPDSILWTGIWFDATVGQLYSTSECTFEGSPSDSVGGGLRLGFDIVPPGSFLHILLGASAMVPWNYMTFFGSQQQENEQAQQLTAWFTLGLGLAAYF